MKSSVSRAALSFASIYNTALRVFYLDFKIFEKLGPDGRVISAANWQAWVPEFDSSQNQNFFLRGINSFEHEICCHFEFNYLI